MPELAESTLAALLASPGYSAGIIAQAQRIANAAEPNEILDLLFETCDLMGVSSAAFVTYIRGSIAHENFRFVLACRPDWCFEYQRTASYSVDPWITYAATHTEPICASEIDGMTPVQKEVYSLAQKFGMLSTCVVPAPSSGRLSRIGMLCIGSDRKNFFEAPGFRAFSVLARSLAMELQGWWIRWLRAEFIQEKGLTCEDIQLLEFERQGLRTKQVSVELALSGSAIDARWKRLNQRFGAPNRKACAEIAAEYGII